MVRENPHRRDHKQCYCRCSRIVPGLEPALSPMVRRRDAALNLLQQLKIAAKAGSADTANQCALATADSPNLCIRLEPPVEAGTLTLRALSVKLSFNKIDIVFSIHDLLLLRFFSFPLRKASGGASCICISGSLLLLRSYSLRQ